MTKLAKLQKRVSSLPEPLIEEVLDFVEFVTTRRGVQSEPQVAREKRNFKGAFRGRLSTSGEFARGKNLEKDLE